MFLGHYALAFAAKRATPRMSAGVLVLAAQFADVLWPIFVALGVEQVRIVPGITAVTPFDFVSYPYSHSLVLLIVWGAAFGVVCRWRTGSDPRESAKSRLLSPPVVAGLLVISHWVLDFASHRPDMPLYPGGPRLGLGLWNSLPATLAIEFSMYIAGLWIYLRSTRARDRAGSVGFWALAVFLVVAYLAALSGPPPSVRALYISALTGAAVVTTWCWWVDRHREAMH